MPPYFVKWKQNFRHEHVSPSPATELTLGQTPISPPSHWFGRVCETALILGVETRASTLLALDVRIYCSTAFDRSRSMKLVERIVEKIFMMNIGEKSKEKRCEALTEFLIFFFFD